MSVNPSLDIESRYRAKAFRAIETVLREDPVLGRVVNRWSTREGVAGELIAPTADQMPMIALTPVPNPSTVFGVDETRINFAVAVQVFVKGTCVDDLFALWEAVEDAIRDSRPFRTSTVREFLCGAIDPAPAGVMMLRPGVPGFLAVDLTRPPKSLNFQGAQGTLTCFLRRPA